MRNAVPYVSTSRATRPVVLLIVLLTVTSACGKPPDAQQLRIVNSGSADIKGLAVLFPGPTADSQALRVSFGDVPAGSTTSYQPVPGGVYRYAAYEYTLDGRSISQPVVDWVGESPMHGQQFTYKLALDLQQPTGGQVQLIEVSVDKP